jgi:hypothetical protein
MAFKIVSNVVYGQAIATNDTTENVTLGAIVDAYDQSKGWGEFIYLKGLASTAIGEVVHYNSDDWSTTLAVANGIGPIAVSMAATVASEYGWYQIQGKGSALALTGFADNADCYLTSTAGSIDDADVAGDYISGMKGASAVSSGLADVELSRPSTADALDN